MLILSYDVIYFLSDLIDIVSGYASNWFDLEFQGSERVLLSEFEHEIDLVLHGIAFVWFAQDIELVGSGFLDDLELIEINVFESGQFILLLSQILHLHTTM